MQSKIKKTGMKLNKYRTKTGIFCSSLLLMSIIIPHNTQITVIYFKIVS